jgi:5-methylcytosine-specific restriction endonuclease McrA
MKLEIDLIPASCWFNNVRSFVSKKQWDIIRSQVASQAYNMCEICGGVGPTHPVECHEIFSYDDENLIQKLEKMIALCPDCHSAKHFGLTKIRGREDEILKHLMKINKITKSAANHYIKSVFKQWSERSQKTWKLDLSHLTEYGINVEEIEKSEKA